MVKSQPANAENVGSIPEQEDPLEKEMATHSSILAWEIPWREEPGGLSPQDHKRVATKQHISIHIHIYTYINKYTYLFYIM